MRRTRIWRRRAAIGTGKVRSADTGRYVKKGEAKRNPKGTVTEHDKKGKGK
jgi:hypothetical protein